MYAKLSYLSVASPSYPEEWWYLDTADMFTDIGLLSHKRKPLLFTQGESVLIDLTQRFLVHRLSSAIRRVCASSHVHWAPHMLPSSALTKQSYEAP